MGYKPGEKITIKMNSNYDRSNSQPWPSGKGLASPHVINAMIVQLVRNAGIPGKDITLYDVANGRYMGDPIYNRIRANPEPDFKEITFQVSPLVAANGRVPPVPSTTDPVRFSNEEIAKTQNPIVQVPQCVVDAKYRINLATWRAHEVAAVTLCAKNNFGSIYWPNLDYWGPRPFHSGWNQKTSPLGSYSIFTDIMGHDQLGEKNILYMIDGLYTAEHSEPNVVRFVSFGDQWTASIFMSQDPVAIDSVGLDFLRSEPRQPDGARHTPTTTCTNRRWRQSALQDEVLPPAARSSPVSGRSRALEQPEREEVLAEPGQEGRHRARRFEGGAEEAALVTNTFK